MGVLFLCIYYISLVLFLDDVSCRTIYGSVFFLFCCYLLLRTIYFAKSFATMQFGVVVSAPRRINNNNNIIICSMLIRLDTCLFAEKFKSVHRSSSHHHHYHHAHTEEQPHLAILVLSGIGTIIKIRTTR